MTDNDRRTILLVEDNAVLSMSAVETLKRLGYDVLTAKSGKLAIEIVTAGTPIDLILMDIDLGRGMNGTEAAEQIIAYRDIPVLFLSSHTETEIVDKTERISSYGYVVKESGDVVLNASIKMAFKLHAEKLRVQAEHEKLEQVNRRLEATIEERKRAEDMTIRHADFRERVFNSIDAALAVVMPDGVISEVNEAWRRFALANNGTDERTWGKGANYFRECRLEAGDATLAAEAYEGLRRVQRGELEHFMMEYACHSPKQRRWFVMRVMPLRGWPGTVLVSHTDITNGWLIREELETIRSRFRMALENSPVTVFAQDADLRYTWIHNTNTGPEPTEIIGKTDAEVIPPADAVKVMEIKRRVLVTGTPGREELKTTVRGRIRYFDMSVEPLRNRDGCITGVIGSSVDITAYREMEEALRGSEALFRSVFEHHTAVKLLIDPATGAILDANEAAVAFYGWTRDQLLRMRIQDINTLPPDEVKAEMEKVKTLRRSYFEFRHRLADGSIRDVAVYSSDIGNGGRSVLHSIVIDITDRKRAEKDREEALEAVQRQLREKDLVLRETHHRIKNNITSIQNLLSLQAAEATDPKTLSALQDAAGRVAGMRVLYDRMLMADRYQEAAVSSYLGGLVDSVVSLLAGETHVVVEKRFDEITLSSKILFPLGLIVNEIVTNMLKHAFAGRESGTVRISASREGKQVTLVLEDDGSGLPPAFNVEASGGFGLTLVRMLCNQLEARLGSENLARGTRWSMVFNAE